MARAKTTTKKAPAKKTPAPERRAPAAKATVAAKPSVIDVEALDRSRDDEALDGSAAALADHAEALAATVKAKQKALARAKVTPADGQRLGALAAALRKRETAWRNLWKSSSTGAVAKAREPARKGRDQLFSALRVFANATPATQSALDDIAGVENDSDLLSDLDRLLALAASHRDDLDGTDSDAAFSAQVAAATEAFRAARSGARESAANAVELSDEAVAARRVRNRVFWELADLDRLVCQRGAHAFRSDPRSLRLFAAYTHRARRPAKKPVTG
jgi:hypothetical protein